MIEVQPVVLNLWRTFAKQEHEAYHDELLAAAKRLRQVADLMEATVTRAKRRDPRRRSLTALVVLPPRRLAKIAMSVANAYCQASRAIGKEVSR